MILTRSPQTSGSLTVSPIPTWLALETQTAVLWWGNVLEASTTLGMWQGLDMCECFLLSVMGSIFWFVVQSLSRVQLFVILWTAAHLVSLSSTISWSLLNLMCIESVMPSTHPILCHPLFLPSVFPSIIFSNESALCIKLPKYWSFSYSISPSNEYSQVDFL